MEGCLRDGQSRRRDPPFNSTSVSRHESRRECTLHHHKLSRIAMYRNGLRRMATLLAIATLSAGGCQTAKRFIPGSSRVTTVAAATPSNSTGMTGLPPTSAGPQMAKGTESNNAGVNAVGPASDDPLYGYYSKADASDASDTGSGGYARTDWSSESSRYERSRPTNSSPSRSSGCSSGCCSQ